MGCDQPVERVANPVERSDEDEGGEGDGRGEGGVDQRKQSMRALGLREGGEGR